MHLVSLRISPPKKILKQSIACQQLSTANDFFFCFVIAGSISEVPIADLTRFKGIYSLPVIPSLSYGGASLLGEPHFYTRTPLAGPAWVGGTPNGITSLSFLLPRLSNNRAPILWPRFLSLVTDGRWQNQKQEPQHFGSVCSILRLYVITTLSEPFFTTTNLIDRILQVVSHHYPSTNLIGFHDP